MFWKVKEWSLLSKTPVPGGGFEGWDGVGWGWVGRLEGSDEPWFLIPSSDSNSLHLELDSLSEWAKLSNLSLNLKKSYELIIHNNYNKITPPSLHPSLQRTSSLTILRVSFTETLNITPHIDNIITKCYQTFHALKIIRAHGLYGPKLYDITESPNISQINMQHLHGVDLPIMNI